MRIGICGDVHWSTYSSIIRRRGDKYSLRLENLIKSINWVENTFKECDLIVYLGDFLDKAELTSEEITALNEITWTDIPHNFLVGNHEMGKNDLSFSSAHLFNLSNYNVIDSPTSWVNTPENLELCFLPYVLDSNRESLETYFPKSFANQRIIFSHNDLKGIQMGMFESKIGFELEEIESNCDLFLNGHLHNGNKISSKIYNVGNITGQNFSEDAFNYEHKVLILDTENHTMDWYTNPYAFNFYKFEYKNSMPKLKDNAVVTIKCKESIAADIKNNLPKEIIESRIVIEPELNTNTELVQETLTVDHLQQFNNYIIDVLGNTEIVQQELMEVLK